MGQEGKEKVILLRGGGSGPEEENWGVWGGLLLKKERGRERHTRLVEK